MPTTLLAIPFPPLDPVALSLGPLVIRWYALAYLAGFLLGWRYALYLVRRHDIRPNAADMDEFLSWAVVGVILGGRLGYVLVYQFDLYRSDPWEILKMWHGGMSFHGGMAGMIVAMVIYARVKRIGFLALADVVACAVPIGLFFGRLANFVNGELWGRVTTVPWAVIFPAARAGGLPRHPSQLYQAGLEGLLLFALLAWLHSKKDVREKHGMLAAIFLAGYGAARLAGELFREPDPQMGYYFGGITMGQILSLPMVIIGVGFVIYNCSRCFPKRNAISSDAA